MSEPSPTPASPTLLDELRLFLRANALVIVAAALAMLLAYGVELTTYSLSIDEEVAIFSESNGSQISQGRPVSYIIRSLLTHTMPLPFFSTALSLAFLLGAMVAFAFLIQRASGRLTEHRVALLVFLVIATTLPVNAYYLMWGETNVSISLGMLLASVSAWFAWVWAVDRWRWTNALAAVLMGFLAVAIYQGLAFVALAGVLVAQLALIIGRDDAPGVSRFRPDLETSVRLALPLLMSVAIGALVTAQLLEPGGYHTAFVGWGKVPLETIATDLVDHVLRYVRGEGFVGGWVLVPTVIAGAALFVVLLVRAFRGRGWWPVLLFMAIALLPFATSVALGYPMPNRALQALPLVAGAMWLLLSLALRDRKPMLVVLLVAAVMMTIWNSSVNARLHLTEVTTFETDRTIAAQVFERLAAQGWDGQPVPIVSVGQRHITPIEDHANDEAFGLSFYNLDEGARTPHFMLAMGHPVLFPTDDQVAEARRRAASMPSWPAAGAVLLDDGIAIVKFSEGDPS